MISGSDDLSARAKDERDLSVLRRARRGDRYCDINRDVGRSGTFAQIIVSRVRDADIRESGETMSVVLEAYPKARQGRG